MKYWSTDNPSRKLVVIGRLDDLARGLGHEAAHAGQLPDLLRRTARARVGHDVDRVERRAAPLLAGLVVDELLGADLAHHLFGDLLRDLRPDVDDLVVALAVGDETLGVLLLDLLHVLLRRLEQLDLARRDLEIVDADRDAGLGRVGVPERPQLVGQEDGLLLAAGAVAAVDEITELLLAHDAVDDLERQLLGDDFVQQHAAAVVLATSSPSMRTRIAACRSSSPWSYARRTSSGEENTPCILLAGIFSALTSPLSAFLASVGLAVRVLALGEGPLARHVVEPEHDVLRGQDDRAPVGGREDVVRRHHEHARFHLRLQRQRHVHRHLVAVEVGVERRADQRVQLDRLALDQQRLEGLDAQAVQRRSAVEENRVLLDDLFEDVPHLGTLLLDQLLGALDGGDEAALFELVVDERLEQLERHLLGQAALVQLQLGADDDDRTARVVDALAEQVLAEAPLLALQHVG